MFNYQRVGAKNGYMIVYGYDFRYVLEMLQCDLGPHSDLLPDLEGSLEASLQAKKDKEKWEKVKAHKITQ